MSNRGTKGIGWWVASCRKLWKLFTAMMEMVVTNEAATNDELKILHKPLRKEKMTLKLSYQYFSKCIHDLVTNSHLKCHKAKCWRFLLYFLRTSVHHAFFVQKLRRTKAPLRGLGAISHLNSESERRIWWNSFEYPIAINGKTKPNHFAWIRNFTIEKKFLIGIPEKIFWRRKTKNNYCKRKMINVVVKK